MTLSHLKVKKIQMLIMLSELYLRKATTQRAMYREENRSKVPNQQFAEALCKTLFSPHNTADT